MIRSMLACINGLAAVGLTVLLAMSSGSRAEIKSQSYELSTGEAVPVGHFEAVGRLPGCTATLISSRMGIDRGPLRVPEPGFSDMLRKVSLMLQPPPNYIDLQRTRAQLVIHNALVPNL